MKILIVGSGGREHALAWRCAATPGNQIFALPGNPGMARIAQCIPTNPLSPQVILSAAQALGVELTIVGPEAPLVAGVVDLFRSANLAIVGPTADCARLEGSKIYAKRFFEQNNIPTARFSAVSTVADALACLVRFALPVVIKADGLASGKGVTIAYSRQEAEEAVQILGPNLVIEEFLEGREVSFIVLSDGHSLTPFLPTRDHKRALNGDRGPNTGGMGAFCDSALLTDSESNRILDQIIWPTIERTSFTGFLYAGVMITRDGPKLLEFNVRLGDPETQVLMHSLTDNLGEVLMSAARQQLPGLPLKWRVGVSHCVVAAAEGYPASFRTGDEITGIDKAEACGATIFHAGTRVGWSGYSTAGGRVLAAVSSAETLIEATAKTYKCLSHINFKGIHYRKDIGRHPDPL